MLGGGDWGAHTPAATSCVITEAPVPPDALKQEDASASLGDGKGFRANNVETAAMLAHLQSSHVC